jgi:hypothetical protein
MEVTRRVVRGVNEPKTVYPKRLMESGSPKAEILQLADRNSNLICLGSVHEEAFGRSYLAESRAYLLPHPKQINQNMLRGLSDLLFLRTENSG